MLKILANRSLSLPCLARSTCIHRSRVIVGNRQLGSQLRSKFLWISRADLYHSNMSLLNPEATNGKSDTLGASANNVSVPTGSGDLPIIMPLACYTVIQHTLRGLLIAVHLILGALSIIWNHCSFICRAGGPCPICCSEERPLEEP